MENIGEKLKHKRLDKKLSLEEISKRTKIQKKILEALEQNKAEEIIGPVYAKSFLKKYALFLGLKTGDTLKEKELVAPAPSPVLTIGVRKAKDSDWPRLIPVVRNTIIVSLVVIISLFLLVKVLRSVHSRVVTTNKKKVEKTIKASSSSSSPAVTTKKVTPPPAPAVKITPSRLLLKTKKDVWVQVKADGHIIFEGFLKKASQEEWAFEKEMHLWVGNAAFVELTLNGKYYGSPGKGVIKDIIVTKEGIKVK